MDNHPHSGVQVVINGHVQGQTYSPGSTLGPQQRAMRPLSVEEALQFSPMTTAPVFGLDSIIRPDVGGSSLTQTGGYNRTAAKKLVQELNKETSVGIDNSARLKEARSYVHELLDDKSLTEFKFVLPTALKNLDKPAGMPTKKLQGPRSRLGPFARMILDSADINFRYPSLTTSHPTVKKEPKPKSSPVPSSSSAPSVVIPSTGKSLSSLIDSKQAEPKLAQPSVVIPPSPYSAAHKYEDPGAMKKRKLNYEGEATGSVLRLKDQKEEADNALLKLQDLLHEIFEAEDRLEPDTSAFATVQGSNTLFRLPNALELHGAILNTETHSRLQKALQKVARFQRLNDIPSEYLTRVQKLCEGPILSVQALDLTLNDPTSESETQEWLRKVEDLHTSLLAIGTLLQTMFSRRSEKELCPEDLIQAIPTALNQLFDRCVIPAVEARPMDKDSHLFDFFTKEKKLIGSLTHQAKKLLNLLANFLSRIDVSEGVITSMEFLAAKLIFVENAHSDKESTVGYQKYESVRRGAMDVLAKIFSKYPSQRPYILDEILVSLEKLPSTRQNARQFKLVDGKNIQLLTALVMQLVQTTALDSPRSKSSKAKRRLPIPGHIDDDEEEDELNSDHKEQEQSDSDGDDDDDLHSKLSLERLASRVDKLYDNAVRSAQYIIKFIVTRAMTSTKTGDQPYRNILDLFTEDLIGVLGSTDWPAAELLLRILASHMVGIAEQDKSPAIAKNMALELLGWMGSGISDLSAAAQHLIPGMDETRSELTDYLRQLFDDHSRQALHIQDLIMPNGPYRITLEYLQDRDLDDWQLSSARGYYLVSWAKTICSTYYDADDKDRTHNDTELSDLLALMTELFSDPRWLETNNRYQNVSTAHGKFAYILTVLNSGFCKAFDTILKVLLSSISSDQAKIRSRSLKSVITMLEKDPSLLDRDSSVMRVILRSATDASPMVRDSALSLIAKCIALRPALEEEGCRAILTCGADPTAGVRKRCIALQKEIYSNTTRKDLKLAILDSLLQRTNDHEEGVATLARQTFEEIWLSPFQGSIDSLQESPKLKVALAEQVTLVVSLVQRIETAADSLGTFLKKIIGASAKSASPNFKVCKAMVANMFERVVDDSESPEKLNQQALLQTVTVFAKANARLFSPDQLETLHPYIGHLVSAEDLFIFRSVVVIYRCVLPYISSSHNSLLREVQNDLFKSVAKLARVELNEVMACLWTINGVLHNTERLVKLTISVLKGINQARGADLSDSSKAELLGRARSYVRIAGCVGRHCDLEKYEPQFKAAFPSWKGGSVAGLLVDSILPFAAAAQPLELRTMALESLGSICQSWPAQFSREESRRLLSSVFKEDNANLQNIILRAFFEFFAIHEGRLEKLVQPTNEAAEAENTTRLGGSLKASDNDGAAALIAQHFLQDMLRVAQSRQDSYALTAIELIASINRQGLVHPKECAGVLVSLETSTVPAIAKVAFDTHKMLHQQYESMFEREYMRAIHEAFCYQRDIVGDSNGALARPYTAKLGPLFDIVKTSNSRYQKKFLSNLCAKVDFELKSLDSSAATPEHLLVSRFVSQNLAFFEYGQLAELHPTIACMERIVAATGTIVAHAIETDIFPTKIEAPKDENQTQSEEGAVAIQHPAPTVSLRTLRHLATASASLSMLWEARSYLRRLYGIHSHVRQKDSKANPKELNRAPTKAQGVTGDKFWEAISKNMNCLESEDAMREKCRDFATLLSIDDELKVAGDEEHDGDSGDDVDGDEFINGANVNGNRPGKRKNSISGGLTPKRPKSKGRNSVGKKLTSSEPDDFAVFD